MTRTEIRHKAYEIIEQRRRKAEEELERHEKEIQQKAPQIAEYRAEIARSGSEILKSIIGKNKNYQQDVEKIRRRIAMAEQEIKTTLARNGYPEDYLTIHYTCPICSDEGHTKDGLCRCLLQAERELILKEINFGSTARFCSFDNFDTSVYSSAADKARMTRIKELCVQYAEKFTDTPKSDHLNLLMIGNHGTGKTHLAAAIARRVTERDFGVIFITVAELMAKVSAAGNGDSDSADLLDLTRETDLLVLDDLGAGRGRDYASSVLYGLLEHRKKNRRMTIITTAYTPKDLRVNYSDLITMLQYDYMSLEFYVPAYTGKDYTYVGVNTLNLFCDGEDHD